MVGILNTTINNTAAQVENLDQYDYIEMACEHFTTFADNHYVLPQDVQNNLHALLIEKTETFRFLPLRFLPQVPNQTREYEIGMGFFNYIFSADGVGYQPILFESNPVLCTQVFEHNLIFTLNVQQHLIYNEVSTFTNLKILLGLAK
jgi:hypothetical protein